MLNGVFQKEKVMVSFRVVLEDKTRIEFYSNKDVCDYIKNNNIKIEYVDYVIGYWAWCGGEMTRVECNKNKIS